MIKPSFSRIAVWIALSVVFMFIQQPSRYAQSANQQSQPEQKTSSQSQPANLPQQDQEAVVRITTQLVQVDAIVTDRKGQHIDDLSEDEFELLVDGKPQPLTFFKLVKLVESRRDEAEKPKEKTPVLTAMPTRQIEPEKVRRTIALVIDDLGLEFRSIAFAKSALKRFVAEQMEEGDLVGIIRTGSGFGIYQQFTSDKRILYAAIDKLRFALNGRRPIPFTLSSTDSLMGRNSVFKTPTEEADERRSDPKKAAREDAEKASGEFRENYFSYGTLGALNYVVRALRPLPGRKVALILSDGLAIPSDNHRSDFIDRMDRLAELAGRSSVSFYSIDVEGLVVPYWTDSAIESMQSSGGSSPIEPEDGLRYLAYQTGGLAFYNNNDTAGLIEKSVDDNRSYYLIGFDPEDETFDRKLHKIQLKVKRPGTHVRTRVGFLGVEEAKAREIPKTPEAQLLYALFSPFAAKDIPYQVTSLFFSSANGEPVIRSYFHIDASKLQFKDESNGEKSTALELVNYTFNEEGTAIEKYAKSFTLRFSAERYRRLLTEGIVYLNDFPIKKPGAYLLRSALRDANSGLLGSSHQFIQIPNLKKNELTLSGIILNSVVDGKALKPVNTAKSAADAATFDVLEAEIQANPAARRFSRDSEIEYQAAIYNPRIDRKTGKPGLLLQFELYRDGKPVFQSPERPVRSDRQNDPKWLDCGGRFQLRNFQTGEYLLRLVVKDQLRSGKGSVAEQWIDFTVR